LQVFNNGRRKLVRRLSPASQTAKEVQDRLRLLADPTRAANLTRLFKTARGQYGEGDQFLGVRVPEQRKVARQFHNLSLHEVTELLQSPIHEDRFTALEILVAKYESGDATEQECVFRIYLQYTHCINNWDLVDTSARYIIGEHLHQRPRKLLYRLAKSNNLWERRIAIVSTHAWTTQGDTEDAYAIAQLLLDDKYPLIHKAVGWTLREAGRHSTQKLLRFLEKHYARLPRTALRYAIEHLPAVQRKQILAGKFG
jgi:3-methyladenine DNA glycosylase AlkD